MAETPAAAHDENPSRLGRFIQNYSGFLSSFVIGVAGLVATSIWQFRQAQNAERQQASEQAIARTKADNDWRIARAEILGKNLSVLSLQGPQTADQRFGGCSRSPGETSSTRSWRFLMRWNWAATIPPTCVSCWPGPRTRTTPNSSRPLR